MAATGCPYESCCTDEADTAGDDVNMYGWAIGPSARMC